VLVDIVEEKVNKQGIKKAIHPGLYTGEVFPRSKKAIFVFDKRCDQHCGFLFLKP
jgi:hypothetical protein